MEKLRVQAINRHRMKTDGEGVTTLIGLHGCHLNCKYCINKRLLSEYKYYNIPVNELVDTVMLDYCYFVATGGGLTLGGGEPLLQYKAILELKNLLPEGVKLNIETSLNVDKHVLESVIDKIDYFIIDIKSMNPHIYNEYTGITCDKLVDNLKYLSEHKLQSKCTIRIPNIPNYTTEEDINKTVDIIKNLGFNNLDIFNYIIKDNIEKEKKDE